MAHASGKDRSTRVSQVVGASRHAVYGAFLDPEALASWLPPDGIAGRIEVLEPREGGRFRMSLTYVNPSEAQRGKTSEDTDTFEGRFAQLLPNERIVWIVEFESDRPGFAGEMRITWTLEDADGGTEVTALCEDIPEGISLEDNELGSRLSLRKLAAYVVP